ncbi:MAG TPA: hypothetical protein VHH32_11150 [Gemmatimonadales bacterium]|nr:hypothetical protein [Gemmatimonadales bacterium]
MPGHVFHPGHAELHGITVVVETQGSRTYIGRYDSEDERGVHLLDVGIHDSAADLSKEEYIRRSAKFGVRSEHPHVLVPSDHVTRITRLGELSREGTPG